MQAVISVALTGGGGSMALDTIQSYGDLIDEGADLARAISREVVLEALLPAERSDRNGGLTDRNVPRLRNRNVGFRPGRQPDASRSGAQRQIHPNSRDRHIHRIFIAILLQSGHMSFISTGRPGVSASSRRPSRHTPGIC